MDIDDSSPHLSEPPLDLSAPAAGSAPHLSEPGAHPGAGAPVHDRYQALGLLGTGGMGRVEAVHDAALGRQVARKRPRADVPGAASALVHEAAVTAALEHPGIVPVYDLGRDGDGTPWYTMRLVRGRTLRAVLAETDTAAGRLALVRPLLSAVQAVAHAHDRGVVHCDLKAANILLGERGEVQVADWGLARAGGGGAGGGTPAAMAPEQARGEAATPRSDVWALGCVLLEVLTGRPPWQGLGRAALRLRLQAGEAPPERPDADLVPAELCAIVDRCLQPEPGARYPDAGALADDLARFLDGRLVLAHVYSPPELLARWLRRHRVAVGVAGLALLVVVGVSALAAVRTVRERDAARAAQRVAVAAQERSDASLADALVLASRTAAARGAWAEAEVLAAQALSLAESPEARGVLAASAGRPRPVRAPDPALPCDGSRSPGPAGRSLCQDEGSVRLDRDGETLWKVELEVQDAAFAGTDVVVSVPGPGLRVLDGDTGEVRHRMESFNVRPLTSGARAAWLHTGTRLARIDAATGAIDEFRPCGDHTVGAVGEGPDGWIHMACAGGGLVDLHVESGTLRPRAFTGDDQAAPIALLSAGPAGRVAVASNRGAVHVSDREQERWALDLDAAVVRLAWTGDGQRLVVGLRGGGAVVLDAESGARLARLPAATGSFVEGRPGSAVWSPGRGGERWDLSALRPGGLGGGAGLSAAIFGDRDDVFMSRGDGSVARYDRGTGALLGAAVLTTRVIKGVVRAPGRPGVVALGAGDGSWWLSPDLSERRLLQPAGGRRIAPLTDHVVVLHYGTRSSRVPLDGGRPSVVLESDGAHAYDLRAAPDGSHAVMVDDNGVIARLDAAWDAQPVPLAQVQRVSCVAAVGDGGVVWVEPGALVLQRDDVELLRAPLADVPTLDCAVSPDGELAAVAGLDGRVRVLDLSDGRLRAVLEGHTERVATVAWDEGRRLLSASWDGTARIWGLEALDRAPDALLAEAQAGWGITATDAVAAGAP